jgi:thioredoxin:protein disulfide reductase
LAFVGVMLGAIHLTFKEGLGKAAFKGAGVLLLVFGLLLRTAQPPAERTWTVLDVGKAESLAPFETALAQAKQEGRPVLIDFFAEWCAACKELDKFTYVAPEVKSETNRFTLVKIDGTNEHNLLYKLYDRFGVQGLPTVAFVDSTGAVLTDPKVTGFLEPKEFLAELKKVK